jgi:signal transduction histidine kinase
MQMNKTKKYVKRLNQLRVKHQVENERRRISRDLHDNIGAYVTRLISKIDLLKTDANNITDENCNDVRLDAEHILALLRQTIFILSNKETTIIALYDNFKTYAQKFFQTDNIKIIFEENAENNRKLDPTTSSSL